MGVVKEPLAQWEIDILRQLADEKPNNVGLTGGQLLEILTRLEQAEQSVARVREVIRQYDPDCLPCMCDSDWDCCKCTVADFEEALDGDTRV